MWSPTGKPVAPSSTPVGRNPEREPPAIAGARVEGSIMANKFPAVRAALVQDLDTARSSREHNDANILVLSGAKTEQSLAKQILETWLATPFAGGRHQRRVDKICQVERDLGIQINGRVKK